MNSASDIESLAQNPATSLSQSGISSDVAEMVVSVVGKEKITNEEMMKSIEYLREAGIIRPRY